MFKKTMFNFLAVTVVFVTTAAHAGFGDKTFGDVRVEEVTSIYDGDTFRVNIPSFPAIIGERMSIRLAQVDTPEIKGKCDKEKRLAQKAKQHTVRMLRSGNNITLQNLKRGKYFRLVADVSIDGVDLASSLIQNGLAVTYDGGRKTKDWCE